jgi:hypothetical protein
LRRLAILNNNACVKQKLHPATVGFAIALLVNSVGCLYRYRSAACKQRGASLDARIETLKREAHEKLKVGAKKDAVIRFFAENGIPLTFNGHEASGGVNTSGCAPSGCGSDAAYLYVEVKVDEAGTVISEPVVNAMYTDCV